MVLTDAQKRKYNKLLAALGRMRRVVLAFSGGVDSGLLLYCARESLGDNILAVTLAPPYLPESELVEAMALTQKMGIVHQVIEIPVHDTIRYNPDDRCYLCKRFLFEKLIQIAGKQGFDTVIEGSNYDDLDDYRPGLRAIRELGICSPLLDTGFTKKDIRALAKAFKLAVWNKPASGCLLTRIPHGTRIEDVELRRIEKGEKFLKNLGLPVVRLRSHGALARIEVPISSLTGCLEPQRRKRIVTYLKELGYVYVTIDLAGYQMGSLNERKGSGTKQDQCL